MVFPNEAAEILIKSIPNIKQSGDWEYYTEDTKWDDYMLANTSKEALNFMKLMSVLTDYATLLLTTEHPTNDEIRRIFWLIENLIKDGNQEVRDAVTTNFLENLINYDSAGRLKASTFVHLLGPESKAYCKAWDEFTGVRTLGLWDE